MLISTVSRINYICKQQRLVPGLKFGDRQNMINSAISTGVINRDRDKLSFDNLYKVSDLITQYDILLEGLENDKVPDLITQYNILQEGLESNRGYANDIVEKMIEVENPDKSNQKNELERVIDYIIFMIFCFPDWKVSYSVPP